MSALRSLGRLNPSSTALFVCDMQEAFRKSIQYFPEIVSNTVRLVEAAKILKMPVIVTEQYPKGLGSTVAELKSAFPSEQKIWDKTVFSMCLPAVGEQLEGRDCGEGERITDVVLTGIECHVCVLQTTLDLIQQNLTVHIAADCVSSRSLIDRKFALDRFVQLGGVIVTTGETVILQLCKDSKHPSFKQLQNLIREPCKDTALLSHIEDPRLS